MTSSTKVQNQKKSVWRQTLLMKKALKRLSGSIKSLSGLGLSKLEGFYHGDASHHGTTSSRCSYFLEDDDVTMFDAQFFSIGPQEAEAMDPQHRLLLEVVYEGLEDAGISLEETSGTATSAYVGLMSADWQDLQLICFYSFCGVGSFMLGTSESAFKEIILELL
ncbi:ketoacyl-synt-domain-containing protein [Colletotrichum zoysiae]|uniref:Ketoacyl-synt-domain-containing protein n=1 Tax=Colletotrichum zoysiae TaxID=1216348 RepID=A0AAD9HKI2_9PEZI|nr:ketoacyl-synt-domain-containing protein [Colletotrichum zoysiae]